MTNWYWGVLKFVLTNTARSAWEAPPIMLGTKLLCPGASRIVKCFFSVSKQARPTSTVLPFSRSEIQWKRTHEVSEVFIWNCNCVRFTFLIRVQRPGQVPRLAVLFARFSFVLFQGTLIYHASQVHDLSTNRWFSSIYGQFRCQMVHRSLLEAGGFNHLPTWPMKMTLMCSFLLLFSSKSVTAFCLALDADSVAPSQSPSLSTSPSPDRNI